MTDLVKRLRGRPAPGDHCSKLIAEAADEIERLTGLVTLATDRIKKITTDKGAEIERLRAKLAEYENVPVRLRHIMATGKMPPDDMK